MSIKDDLLADQEATARDGVRRRCKTCIALAELDPEARDEYSEDIMTDQSFQDRSIARWLSEHTSQAVSESSVDTHRKNHMDAA